MSNEIFPSDVRGLTYTVVKTQENSVLTVDGPNFINTNTVQNLNPRWHWRLEYSVLFDSPLYPNPTLSYTDLQQLLGFCQARYGQYDDFLYFDPDDNFVGPGVITATWQPNYPYALGAVIINSGHAQQVISAPAGARSSAVPPAFSISGGTTNDGLLAWQDLGPATSGGTNWPNPFAQLQLVTDGTNFYSPIQRKLGGQFWEDITDLKGGITVYSNGVVTGSYSLQMGGLLFPGFESDALFLNWGPTTPTAPITATFNYYFRVRFEDSIQDFEKFANNLWAVGGEQGSSGKGYIKFKSDPPYIPAPGPGGIVTGPFIPIPISPPVAFPPGATKFLIIWPGNVTYDDGSGPGTLTGYGFGQAGPSAWFAVESHINGLGSVGGQVYFTNYRDPGIPRARIDAAYSYTTYTRYPMTNFQSWGDANGGTSANGVPLIGGILDGGPAKTTFNFTSLFQGGVNPFNLNYSTIFQQFAAAGSAHSAVFAGMIGSPRVVIFYH